MKRDLADGFIINDFVCRVRATEEGITVADYI